MSQVQPTSTAHRLWDRFQRSPAAGYVAAVVGVALAAALLSPVFDRIDSVVAAVAMLMVVLLVATAWGSRPAILASLLGMLYLNFFFLESFSLDIADPDDWLTLIAFLVTSVTVGELSSRAKRRAEEAEAGQREIQRLYEELQAAFERASYAEALKQSERLKSALLDAVTHDLRTPLTSIKASVTTLLQPPHPDRGEQGRELLEVINEEADRLNHLIEGLVDLARIEAGEIGVRRSWAALDDILKAALDRAQPLTRHHTLESVLEENLPPLSAEPRALAQVIFSLVENAAQHSPPGSRIRIEARRAGDAVCIAVQDQGPGIPPEFRQRVFEKFFRAGEKSGKRVSGLGLGLAIARGIAEAHGGSIRAEDADWGSGTRMVVTLPLGSVPAGRHEAPEPAPPSTVGRTA